MVNDVNTNLRHKIDNSPMGGYQWAIVIMAAVMNFLDSFDVLAIAFTAINISKDFGLSKTEFGLLVSVGLAGMTIGSLFLAPFADKIGRRPLLLLSVALSAIGMFISAISTNDEILGLSRLITGLGVGGILVETNVLTSEYSSKNGVALRLACTPQILVSALDWRNISRSITKRVWLAFGLLCRRRAYRIDLVGALYLVA